MISTSLTDKAAERASVRARARRVRRLRLAALVAVAVLLVGAGSWLLLMSRAFSVDQVRVSGLSRLGVDQVQEQARIAGGTPLARLDAAAVERRIARLAPVRRVEVARDWPSGVHIRVRERTAAAVRPSGALWTLVDRSGVGFDIVRRRPPGLPVVSTSIDQGPETLAAALDVLDTLPTDVRDQVREIRAASVESVTLRLGRGRTVVWGSPDRGERKAAVLAVLLSRRASVYDVSAPDTPTTRR